MIKSSLFHLAFLFSVAVLPLTVSSVSAEIANESSLIAKGGHGHGGGDGRGDWGGGHSGSHGDWGRGGSDWGRGGSDWNRGGDWGGGNFFYLDTGYPYNNSYYNQSYYDPYYYNTGSGLYFGY